jgi:hypothetical protein
MESGAKQLATNNLFPRAVTVPHALAPRALVMLIAHVDRTSQTGVAHCDDTHDVRVRDYDVPVLVVNRGASRYRCQY